MEKAKQRLRAVAPCEHSQGVPTHLFQSGRLAGRRHLANRHDYGRDPVSNPKTKAKMLNPIAAARYGKRTAWS